MSSGLHPSIIAALEELIIAVRKQDMIGIANTYVKHLMEIAKATGYRRWEEATKEERVQLLTDMADRLMKSGLGYAPLVNSGLVLQRIAKRIEEDDPILSKASLPRLIKCVVDVFERFLHNAVERATEQCRDMSYDVIALHVWGSLSFRCAKLISSSTRKAKFLVFGANSRKWASQLKSETNAGVTVIPPLYAYQVTRVADAIIFQPETVTPGLAIARTGIAPVLEYPEPQSSVEVIATTISLAYQPRRGAIMQAYHRLPRTPHRLSWQDIVDIPLFDLVNLGDIHMPIKIIDEQGEAKLKPAILRRKALGIVRELEQLVETRCRVYEPSS